MKSYEALLAKNLLDGLDGDDSAYRRFLHDLRGALRTHIQKKLTLFRQAHLDLDDVVQETLLAVHRKAHTYDRETPVTAWISAIARYKLIDMMRRSITTYHVPIADVEEVLKDTTGDLEFQLTLRSAICSLPEKMKAAIKLVKIQGMSVREAALTTGTTESSVKVNIHRATHLIRGFLNNESR